VAAGSRTASGRIDWRVNGWIFGRTPERFD